MPKTSGESLDTRPLHERIAADLRDAIMCGDYPPGAKLPSTQQLKDRFDASSATVQKALSLLKDEGLAVGRAGASVTVREHRQETIRPADYIAPAEPGQPYRWVSEAAKRNRRGSSKLLEVGEVVPPADVAGALGLVEGERALLRSRLMLLDDEPAELAKSYYPLEIVRGTAIMERRKIRGGTPTLLAEMGYPSRRCVDHVAARVPTQEQAAALTMPSDLPVLRTFRVVLSDEDRPIEVTVMIKAGHMYELEYEFS
jgi:GntR family transcriptional regulator